MHQEPSRENQLLLKLVLGETEKQIIESFEKPEDIPFPEFPDAAAEPAQEAKSRPGLLARLFRHRA